LQDHGSSVSLSSLVIGALAGAGVALLMATRAASATRPLVSGKVRGGTEHARVLASRAKEKGRHLAQAAAEQGAWAADYHGL
jgi:gas vesicle protein